MLRKIEQSRDSVLTLTKIEQHTKAFRTATTKKNTALVKKMEKMIVMPP
jgi:hypothetical protein